jgi:hypothetical protein
MALAFVLTLMALAALPMVPASLTAQTPGQAPAQTQAPSQAQAAKPLTPETQAALEILAGHMLLNGQAYEYDRQLSDGIGARLTGSANYVKAVDWAVQEFNRLGLKNVHRESWTIPATWEPEILGSGRILTPHEQRLHLESDGWSPSTPDGGIRGPVFHLPSENSAEMIQADAAKIKGAIILIDADSQRNGPEAAEGVVADNDKLLAKLGALAILTSGTTQNAVSVGGSVWDGTLLPLPTANLGDEDAKLLRRLLDLGPVTIEFSFRNRIREHVQVDNVVAEIPGRELPNEFVLIGAHLDSWHPGTGAQDNGTGDASVLAVAQAVMALNRPPRRTLRFTLFGGEEEGLLGSIAYAKAHAAELKDCAAVLITDSGGEAPKGWVTLGREDVTAALVPLKPLLAGLGAAGTTEFGRIAFGTDQADFMVRGVPSLVLWTGFDKYRALHHKPSDTFDKVDQRDLSLGAAVVGVTAYAIADGQGPFAAHLTPAQVEEQMKQIKVYDDFKDMRDRGILF